MIILVCINVLIGCFYIFNGKKLRINKDMCDEEFRKIMLINFIIASIIMAIFLYIGYTTIFPSLIQTSSSKNTVIDKNMIYMFLYTVTSVIDIVIILNYMKDALENL